MADTTISAELPRAATAPRQARSAVADHLSDVVPAGCLDRVLLAVSELVTNAVLHGRGPIELRVTRRRDRVLGEVVDQGAGFEHQARTLGLETVGGRGLAIVAAVSDRWGIHEGSSHVWFEVELAPDDLDQAEPRIGKRERPRELE